MPGIIKAKPVKGSNSSNELPPFPLESLPPSLRNMAEGIHETTGVPIDMWRELRHYAKGNSEERHIGIIFEASNARLPFHRDAGCCTQAVRQSSHDDGWT